MLATFTLRIKFLVVVCHILLVCGQGEKFTNRNGTINLFKLATGHSSIIRTIEIAPQDFDTETEALAFQLNHHNYGPNIIIINFFEGEVSPSNKRRTVETQSWFVTKEKLFIQLPAFADNDGQASFLNYLTVSTKFEPVDISSQESKSGVIQKYLAVEKLDKLPSFTFRREKYENMFIRQESVYPLPMTDCHLTTNIGKEGLSVVLNNEEDRDRQGVFYDNVDRGGSFASMRYEQNQNFVKGQRYQIHNLNITLQVSPEDSQFSTMRRAQNDPYRSENSFEPVSLCGLALYYNIAPCPNDMCMVRVGSQKQRELFARFIYDAHSQTIQLYTVKDKKVVHAELVFLETMEKSETVFNEVERLTRATFPISRFQDFMNLLNDKTSYCEAITYIHKNETATFQLACQ